MHPPKVKICCISSLEEAQMAIAYRADALGLVGPMPSGPGIINSALAGQIAQSIPPTIASFYLTCETVPHRIVTHYQKVNSTTIQLVDVLNTRAYPIIRKFIPHIKLVQVIHVMNEASIQQAVELSEFVDAILLDSGNLSSPVKEFGGTGRTHNWELSRRIREAIDIPLFLAGGLNSENVNEAIETVQPFGVDVCSGVRSDGQLDEQKLKAFFDAILN